VNWYYSWGREFVTTKYLEAFLAWVENESCAKQRYLPVIKPESVPSINHFSSAIVSQSGQSGYDPYDLSSDDDGHLMPTSVAKTPPGQSDCAAHRLAAAMLYYNSPPELPHNWGQLNPNQNDYYSDPMEISRAFWILDITDQWHQKEEMHSKHANLSNVPHDIFSIGLHGVGVEGTVSLWRDGIGWR